MQGGGGPPYCSFVKVTSSSDGIRCKQNEVLEWNEVHPPSTIVHNFDSYFAFVQICFFIFKKRSRQSLIRILFYTNLAG